MENKTSDVIKFKNHEIDLKTFIEWDDYFHYCGVLPNLKPPKKRIPNELKRRMAKEAKRDINRTMKSFGRKGKQYIEELAKQHYEQRKTSNK